MTERHEVRGLDTLRFVAAATVALSHGAAFPLGAWLGKGAGWERLLIGAYDVSFDGVAAVIVFFVISGFCIHYGPATGAPFRLLPFWVRRGVRIAIPLAGAIAVADVLGAAAKGALEVVLWSVYCELIYYALYPALRAAFARFGLRRILLGSCVIAAAIIGVGWATPYYWTFSPALTWLICLPAWLLGCVLAEQVAKRRGGRGPDRVWLWRAATWAYAAGATAVFFHGPLRIGYPLLLFPFQLLAFKWVSAETAHFEWTAPSALLEWGGRWSYSLYLIHNIAIAETPLSTSALAWSWGLRIGLVVAGSLAFFFVVEAPSHRLARAAARRLAQALPPIRSGAPGLASP
jgi:peptidoglycan/LPS O-acetylase OafA/YrhL